MTVTTKSTSLTNLDATPVVQNTAGAGAAGRLKHVNDYLTAPTNAAGTANANINRLVRVPTTAKVKFVYTEGAAQTKGAYNVGVYYSDSTVDGTAAANQGLEANSSKAFFASSQSFASAVARTDVTNQSGTYTVAKRNQPLWQAIGLTTDPGGYFDICATSVATVSVAGLLACEVGYIE